MDGQNDRLIADLARLGVSPEATHAALEIDGILQRWRRRMLKRELGQRALVDLDLRLDLAQLDVLMAIWAPANEFADDAGDETMVSTVAARLGIDPSRASRLVADVIAQGLARRAVSQRDARRTVVELTEAGLATVQAVRDYKFLVMGEFLQGWSAAEIATFVPLLERFSVWTDQADPGRSPALAARIAALRAGALAEPAEPPRRGASAKA
jgi:DNA-binding MarR family transcriptional regulator